MDAIQTHFRERIVAHANRLAAAPTASDGQGAFAGSHASAGQGAFAGSHASAVQGAFAGSHASAVQGAFAWSHASAGQGAFAGSHASAGQGAVAWSHASAVQGADPAIAWLADHRLIPLHDHPALAPHLRAHLGLLRRLVLGENLARVELFKEIALILGAASPPVPLAPLKGISLLDTVYRGDLGLRHMSDLDLLVPEGRIQEAVALLEARGFRETEVSRRVRRIAHHRGLYHPRSLVELHTRLGAAFIPFSTWSELAPRPVLVHGVEAYRLSPAAELVHLLVHFYKHRPFVCLVWLDEILGLAEGLSGDDQRHAIPVIAARLGCRTPLAVTIDLLRRALGPGFLPELRLADLRPSALRVGLHRWLFLGPPDPLRPMPRRSRLLEEFHSALLVDHPAQAPREMLRMAAGHFLARYPTRIPPHPEG
jgi:hypothetical protein